MNRKFLKKAPGARSSNATDDPSDSDSNTTPTNPSKSFNTTKQFTDNNTTDRLRQSDPNPPVEVIQEQEDDEAQEMTINNTIPEAQ